MDAKKTFHRFTIIFCWFLLAEAAEQCSFSDIDGDHGHLPLNTFKNIFNRDEMYRSELDGSHSDTQTFAKPLVDNCTLSDLDLLLVADGTASELYWDQGRFFRNLLDIFDLGKEDDFTRVNVSIVAACPENETSTVPLHPLAAFGQFSNKTDLRNASYLGNNSLHCTSGHVQDIQNAALKFLRNSSCKSKSSPSSVSSFSRSSLVIILIQSHRVHTKMISSSEKTWAQSRNVRMLTVFLTHDSLYNIDQECARCEEGPLYGKVIESSKRLFPVDQAIPLIICRECYPGWIFHSLSGAKSSPSLATSSCYKFLDLEDRNWMTASLACMEKHMSFLVSIESKEELGFLENMIRGNSTLVQSGVNVFIGLKRTLSSLQREFEWISTNPLVFPFWKEGEPYGRKTKECAVWEFAKPAKSTGAGNVSEGWSGIGCGVTVPSIAVCESQAWVSPSKRRVMTPSVSQRKKKEALQKGDIVFNVTSGIKSVDEGFFSSSTLMAKLTWIVQKKSKEFYFSVYLKNKETKSLKASDIKLFRCITGDKIPYSYVADNIPQCKLFMDDEVSHKNNIYYSEKLFTCASGQKVPINEHCDSFPDCPDGSDEKDTCISCNHKMCPSGECLPLHWFYDDVPDCTECQSHSQTNSDSTESDVDCVFLCNRTACVSRAMLGDGFVDCQGPEGPLDETIGSLESTTCRPTSISSNSSLDKSGITNWGPKCVLVDDVYGGILGCRNFQHLQDCEKFVCQEGFVKCPNSYCIPLQYVNDQKRHCPMGEDETDMKLNCTDLFRCSITSDGVCLHPDSVCDGKRDCDTGDDELNCHVECREGFLCVAGTVVTTDYNKSIPLTDLDFIDKGTRYLDLSGVDVSGAIGTFVCQNWKLKHLNLSQCNINGTDSNLCTKSEWLFLSVLDLSFNPIDDETVMDVFQSVPFIQYLNLSNCEKLKSLKIPNIEELKEIDLSYSGITHLQFAGNFKYLNSINLRGSKISELKSGMFPKCIAVLDLRDLELERVDPDSFQDVQRIGSLYTSTYKLCCPQYHDGGRGLTRCHSPNDPFSSCSDLMEGVTMRALIWINGLLALVGNVVVVVNRLVYNRCALRMAYGHFVVHLSISDFFMGVYLLVIASADSYFRDIYYMSERSWLHSGLCKFAGFLSTLSSETSMFFILLITLDRFLVIKFPFGQYRISLPFVHVLSVMAWVLGLFISLAPFLPPFQDWQMYSFNGVCIGLPLGDRTLLGFQFSVAVFVYLNLGLFILIAVGQVVIFRAVGETRRGAAHKTSKPIVRRAEDIEVAKRLFLVAASDFMCWFPVGVMGLVSLLGYQLGYHAYAWAAILVIPINSAINPILYNAANIVSGCKTVYQKTQKLYSTYMYTTEGSQPNTDGSRGQ